MWLLLPWLLKGNRLRYVEQLPRLKQEVERRASDGRLISPGLLHSIAAGYLCLRLLVSEQEGQELRSFFLNDFS